MTDEELQELFFGHCDSLQVRADLRVVEGDWFPRLVGRACAVPMLSRVYIARKVVEESTGEVLDCLLAHEASHIAHDSGILSFSVVMLLVLGLFFNPVFAFLGLALGWEQVRLNEKVADLSAIVLTDERAYLDYLETSNSNWYRHIYNRRRLVK